MAIHAHAVAEPVREVLESGAVARVDDDLARGGIELLERHARLAAFSAAVCACFTMSKTFFILSVGLAEHERPGDVRLVAFDRAAVVEHDDRALADGLRLDRSVGQRGVLADLDAGLAWEADLVVRLRR